MLSSEDTIKTLMKLGFKQTDNNTKTIKFEKDDLILFVKVSTRRHPLVVHPSNQNRFGMLEAIGGVSTYRPMQFYHNSTMRAFPSRINKGKTKTKYGVAFGCCDETSLSNFVKALFDNSASLLLDDLDSISSEELGDTEKVELRKTRIGQGKFRDHLIEEFNGTCPLTFINRPDLLRASHIKPWADSNNSERLDKNNGLLLAANADALFDKGYISFDERGRILVSSVRRQII